MWFCQLLLVACVAEVAAEVVHMLWVIGRGDRLIFSKNSFGTARDAGEGYQGQLTTSVKATCRPSQVSIKLERLF